MINKIVHAVCSTEIIPVAGGSAGAVVGGTMSYPSTDMLLTTAILSVVGATVGYVVKLLLDYIVKRSKQKRGPKTEYR